MKNKKTLKLNWEDVNEFSSAKKPEIIQWLEISTSELKER